LLSSALALASTPLFAQIHRVADLRTEIGEMGMPEEYSYALDLARLGENALLLANLTGVGTEPWISDGTRAGTEILENIAPGSIDSEARLLGASSSHAVFVAWHPVSGRDVIWATDGTEAGTRTIFDEGVDREPLPVWGVGSLPELVLWGIVQRDGVAELWRSDGTRAGTRRIETIGSPEYPGGCWDHEGVAALGRVWFCGQDTRGAELWVSDGTPAGTFRLRDLRPGPRSGRPGQFTAAEGRVYFLATRNGETSEVWTSDGTPEGTRPVFGDAIPDPSIVGSSNIVGSVGSRLLFERIEEPDRLHLWSTDGTPEGTVRLLPRYEGNYEWQTAGSALQVGPRALFAYRTEESGYEPWVSDGTEEGTSLLADLVSGPADGFRSRFVPGHDGAYFCSFFDDQLRRTDGTPEGTVVIASIYPCSGFASGVALAETTLFNSCWTSACEPHHDCDYCYLWRTDGSAAGTFPIWPRVGRASSYPGNLTPGGRGLIFSARADGTGYDGRYFETDGAEASTLELRTTTGQAVESRRSAATLPGGDVLVTGTVDDIGDLYRLVDGALAPVLEGEPGTGIWNDLFGALGFVFFPGYQPGTGWEPWRTDGTSEGSELLGDLEPGPASSQAHDHAVALDRLWFGADGGRELGDELWESDGTPAGTIPHDLNLYGGGSEPRQIRELSREDGTLLLVAGSTQLFEVDPANDTSREIWVFDPESPEYWRQYPFVAFEGDAVLIDAEPDGRCALWRTDGTAPGTVRLATTRPGRSSGWGQLCASDLLVAGGALWFGGCDAEHGCELWTSDGTVSGTRLFADLVPGPDSLAPSALTAIEGRLYFSGCASATGCEPWVSDFTPEGSHALGDAARGPLSSDPIGFTRAGPWIYFAADDGTGEELWAHSLALFADGFETGDTSRWSGVSPATEGPRPPAGPESGAESAD
jgi:ELWxxDGT repeat protein